MNTTLRIASLVLGLVIASAASALAAPVTVSCPGVIDPPATRQFTLTTDPGTALCFDWGTGNLSGNPGGGNPDPFLTAHPEFSTFDKSDDAITGLFEGALTIDNSTTGGPWSIDRTGMGNQALVIAFKINDAQGIFPSWAAFLLPGGIDSADWTATGRQGLSHAIVYGRQCQSTTEPGCGEKRRIPEPTMLGLLGVGLLATAHRLRRR
jgi:hypothetical protein